MGRAAARERRGVREPEHAIVVAGTTVAAAAPMKQAGAERMAVGEQARVAAVVQCFRGL